MSRMNLPTRRVSWTQKAHIENQTFYLSFGEFPDGRLAEVWVEAHKEGTFARGALTALARIISVCLQSGVPVADIVKALRGLDYPPKGEVNGSSAVQSCTSIADWLAQEIAAYYGENAEPILLTQG